MDYHHAEPIPRGGLDLACAANRLVALARHARGHRRALGSRSLLPRVRYRITGASMCYARTDVPAPFDRLVADGKCYSFEIQ